MALNHADIVSLAVDSFKGHVPSNYSVGEANDTIRQALIDLNGGDAKLNWKSFRNHPELYAVVEEIITRTTLEGLPSDSPLFQFVDFRNLALGDSMRFIIERDDDFIVSQIAEGTQGIRRQRLNGKQAITPPMKLYAVKIYEELNRVLSGRVDFNEAINKIARAFDKKINADIFNAVTSSLGALSTPYKQSGTFDIGKLMTIIDHVEAANGGTATIITSKQGARAIVNILGADATSAKEDLYNIGYFSHIGENPIIAMRNAHQPGTTNFVLDNDIIVVSTEDKFIKMITEGDTTIIDRNPLDNADLSHEYFVAQRYGIATAFSGVAGYYDLP